MKLFFAMLIFPAFLHAVVETVTWTMINVNSGQLQGDAHLLEMPDGKRFLIDACGNNEALLRFLAKKQIRKIDEVFISHMHKDHYGGLLELVTKGTEIGQLRMTRPSEKTCKGEIPWGCDWEDVRDFEKKIREFKIPIQGYKNSEVLYHLEKTRIEVIVAYPSSPTPVGEVDVNDTSAVLKLTHGNMTVLFTGDLNRRIGGWLAEQSLDLRAELLKVPHHGTEATAPNSFFDKVAAKIALVPSPEALWLSENSRRLREYFSEKGTKIYVNGLSGDVRVLINSDSITIDPEFKKPTLPIHYTKSLLK